jgi:hypothetical protein
MKNGIGCKSLALEGAVRKEFVECGLAAELAVKQ